MVSTDCYRCFLEKRTTPATWVTRQEDFYCTPCLAAEGIAAADCISIGTWRTGTLERPQAPKTATRKEVAKTPEPVSGRAQPSARRSIASEARVPCARPGCQGTHRAASKYPFCSPCQRSGFKSSGGKSLITGMSTRLVEIEGCQVQVTVPDRRVCEGEGCSTILSTYNKSNLCSLCSRQLGVEIQLAQRDLCHCGKSAAKGRARCYSCIHNHVLSGVRVGRHWELRECR
jgi:hypothetical protein